MTPIDEDEFERARAKVLRAFEVGSIELTGATDGRLDRVSRHAHGWWRDIQFREWNLHVAVVELPDVRTDIAVGRVVVGFDQRRPNLEYRLMPIRCALRRDRAELKPAGALCWASSIKLLQRAEHLAERIVRMEAELRENELVPVIDGLPQYDES